MTLIQIISIIGSIIFLAMILTAVYRNKLQDAYALLWIFTGLLIFAVSSSSAFLGWISDLLGIQTPALAIFLILICGILLILFQQSIVITKQQERIRKLAEEVALLKAEK